MLTFLVAQKRLISQVDSDLSSVFCYFLLMNYQHLLTSLLTSQRVVNDKKYLYLCALDFLTAELCH